MSEVPTYHIVEQVIVETGPMLGCCVPSTEFEYESEILDLTYQLAFTFRLTRRLNAVWRGEEDLRDVLGDLTVLVQTVFDRYFWRDCVSEDRARIIAREIIIRRETTSPRSLSPKEVELMTALLAAK